LPALKIGLIKETFKESKMANIPVEYLTDSDGNTRAVVIPIELWRQLLPQGNTSIEDLAESLEDYCLSKAMDEARESPLLSREEALQYLESEEDED
jgi:hypothetical protein